MIDTKAHFYVYVVDSCWHDIAYNGLCFVLNNEVVDVIIDSRPILSC